MITTIELFGAIIDREEATFKELLQNFFSLWKNWTNHQLILSFWRYGGVLWKSFVSSPSSPHMSGKRYMDHFVPKGSWHLPLDLWGQSFSVGPLRFTYCYYWVWADARIVHRYILLSIAFVSILTYLVINQMFLVLCWNIFFLMLRKKLKDHC